MKSTFALAVLAALPWVCPAQSIQVTKGAVSHRVYQQNERGVADIPMEGRSSAAEGKAIEARVLSGNAPLPGFDWKTIAKVSAGAWNGVLAGVPVGGPYRIEVRAAGTLDVATAPNVLVGDLWILAGQSNMEGVGNLDNLPKPSPQVNSFDMTDRWVVAQDPLHRLVDAANRVHWRRVNGQPQKLEGDALNNFIANRRKGAGVGLPFALEMVARTGVPIGLIPCAHGGTSMAQWSPDLKEQGGDSLYGGMVRRHKEVGGRVRGVLWYQGESDANPKAAPLFEQKFKEFVAAVRRDFNQPDLPFYYVQIGRHVDTNNVNEWNQVQDVQRRLESEIAKSAMVTCIDCQLDDGIHVGTDDFLLLGKRLANVACHDLYPGKTGCGDLKRGPRPKSAVFANGVIRVEFDEVNGKLTHAGRLSGFTVHDETGAALPRIYRQRVSAAQGNVVELLVGGKMPPNLTLRYGAGKDPYVNLRDEAGMACPVFGPFPVQQQQ